MPSKHTAKQKQMAKGPSRSDKVNPADIEMEPPTSRGAPPKTHSVPSSGYTGGKPTISPRSHFVEPPKAPLKAPKDPKNPKKTIIPKEAFTERHEFIQASLGSKLEWGQDGKNTIAEPRHGSYDVIPKRGGSAKLTYHPRSPAGEPFKARPTHDLGHHRTVEAAQAVAEQHHSTMKSMSVQIMSLDDYYDAVMKAPVISLPQGLMQNLAMPTTPTSVPPDAGAPKPGFGTRPTQLDPNKMKPPAPVKAPAPMKAPAPNAQMKPPAPVKPQGGLARKSVHLPEVTRLINERGGLGNIITRHATKKRDSVKRYGMAVMSAKRRSGSDVTARIRTTKALQIMSLNDYYDALMKAPPPGEGRTHSRSPEAPEPSAPAPSAPKTRPQIVDPFTDSPGSGSPPPAPPAPAEGRTHSHRPEATMRPPRSGSPSPKTKKEEKWPDKHGYPYPAPKVPLSAHGPNPGGTVQYIRPHERTKTAPKKQGGWAVEPGSAHEIKPPLEKVPGHQARKALAISKAGEAPAPEAQGSGPPKKFPRRDKTPNVLGKPMKGVKKSIEWNEHPGATWSATHTGRAHHGMYSIRSANDKDNPDHREVLYYKNGADKQVSLGDHPKTAAFGVATEHHLALKKTKKALAKAVDAHGNITQPYGDVHPTNTHRSGTVGDSKSGKLSWELQPHGAYNTDDLTHGSYEVHSRPGKISGRLGTTHHLKYYGMSGPHEVTLSSHKTLSGAYAAAEKHHAAQTSLQRSLLWIAKGPGFKPTPVESRTRKPRMGHITASPLVLPKNDIKLDIGPATVTEHKPEPAKPDREAFARKVGNFPPGAKVEYGHIDLSGAKPDKPVQARKGLSINDLNRALAPSGRRKKPITVDTVYLPGVHTQSEKAEIKAQARGPIRHVQAAVARMTGKSLKGKGKLRKMVPGTRPTTSSKKSPRVLDGGDAALLNSMSPPTLMKPENVIHKSEGASAMSKTNFNDLFKSELGIPSDEVLCDCPHCDTPITKSDLVTKASGGEMVVTQNPKGGTMRGGDGRGVITPSRGVPGAKETDEVRMVGKSKKKMSKAHDSDSDTDEDAVVHTGGEKMGKSVTVRGTDWVQYVDDGSDAALAKSIAEGRLGQEPTQPLDLNNDLTRLLV